MTLEEIIGSFACLTRDPVAIGCRPPGTTRGQCAWLNDSFTRTFGYTADEFVGASMYDLLAPEYRDGFLEKITPYIDSGEGWFANESLCLRKDGTTFWASVSVSALPEREDGSRYSITIYHDLSHLKRRERLAEKAVAENQVMLRESEDVRSRMHLAIDSIATPLAIWDKDWKLVVCNSAFASRLLGRGGTIEPGSSVEEVLREAAYGGQFSEALGKEEAWLARSVASLKAGPIDEITRYTDGRICRATSTTAPNGDTIIYNADITEFTEQKHALEIKNMQLELARAEADLRALHDDLTSLGNRRFIGEGLRALLEDRETLGGEIATLAIDLDRFKQINDTLGHAAGDFVLASVAGRLRSVVESGDLLGRIGGDEFVVLRRVTSPCSAPEDLGQRIVETMSQPFHYEDTELRLGASVGIAQTPLSLAEDLLTNADIALYKAKSAGRGAVVIFDERDLSERMRAKRLSDEILGAIEKRAFVPFFQPQIDVATGCVVAVEALARWTHPGRGSLSPSVFLQTAQELGVQGLIDEIVFDQALDCFADAFSDETAPCLSFNVSEDRLMSGKLVSDLSTASAYPGRFSVELLETIFFDDLSDGFHLQLDTLREMGVGIEIDDFGSGRASIIGLEQISPARLKIDRRLVAAVDTSERSAKLIRSIVDIGHALGIGITAEGVETASQADSLKRLGCDRLQGHLFGPPMAFTELVSTFGLAPGRRARGVR